MEISENPITVNLQVKPSRWVLDFALSGQMFTGFANVLYMPTGVNVLYQSSLPHLCFVPLDHPLSAGRGAIRLEDLATDRVIGLQGEVADELRIRRVGKDSLNPVTAETSLSAFSLARCTNAIPIIDAFTANYWKQGNDGVLLEIEDLPQYQFAVFEPSGASSSEIDRVFQKNLISEIRDLERILSRNSY